MALPLARLAKDGEPHSVWTTPWSTRIAYLSSLGRQSRKAKPKKHRRTLRLFKQSGYSLTPFQVFFKLFRGSKASAASSGLTQTKGDDVR